MCIDLYYTNWVINWGISPTGNLSPAPSFDLGSTHYKGCDQGQQGTHTGLSSGVVTNFLSLFQSRIKCWLSQFGTSCWWEVPLIFIGPDSAELLIAVALG